MQRASFSPLAVDDPDIFAVRVEGPLGTREKATVESFVAKCRERRKSKILFDFSALTSLGGANATVLAQFARELSERGHPPQFVGASDVVRSFLTGRCEGFRPSFVDSVDIACKVLQGAVDEARLAALRSEPQPANAPSFPGLPRADAIPLGAAPGGSGGGGAHSGVVSERQYFSLEEAERWLSSAKTPSETKVALTGLLFGADLADACYLFHKHKGRLVESEMGDLSLPMDGGVAATLLARRGPIPIVDLGESQISEAEADLLSQLNCQMAIPLLNRSELDGVLFLRKRQAGQEYEPGEALALDLLVRQIAKRNDSKGASDSSHQIETASRDLKEKIYRQQTLARVSKELNSIRDEEHVRSVLLVTLMSELGAGSVALYDLEGNRLRPSSAKGVDLADLPVLEAPDAQSLEGWTQSLIQGRSAGSKGLQKLLKELSAVGLNLLAPLRGGERLLGVVAMGAFRSGDSSSVDHDYLQALLQHAGVAVMNTYAFRDLHQQTLNVARTIMSLAERRAGLEQSEDGDRVRDYVTRIARAMNYAPEDMRELTYGAVLRDIGMIEISDLVLRSPRKLSPEEWKLVQRHPVRGAEILRDLGFSEKACEIVLHHHERFNGEGYPNALRGAAIPLGSRILSVVESYLAMTRDLPYRAALSIEEAVEVLRENWEMRYDPEVVTAFVTILQQEESR